MSPYQFRLWKRRLFRESGGKFVIRNVDRRWSTSSYHFFDLK